jgi:hypothetical protein
MLEIMELYMLYYKNAIIYIKIMQLYNIRNNTIINIILEIMQEYEGEILDEDNPNSYYYVYICKIDDELVKKKNDRLNLNNEILKRQKKTRKGAHPV